MSEGRFCARRERKVKRAGKSVDGKVKCVQVSRSSAVQKSVVPFQRAPRQSALSDRRRILMGEHTKETAEGKKVRAFLDALSRGLFLRWRCQALRRPVELIFERNLEGFCGLRGRQTFSQNSCKVSRIFPVESGESGLPHCKITKRTR
jgi:hypothetical protein